MAIFGLKPWINPFEKMSIFRRYELFVFIAQISIFFFLEYRKEHFLGLYCLKMAIFRPKPWVNPFGKMSTFHLFELLVFTAQKGVFSFQNIVKDVFLAYIASKKKVEKLPFLNQNPGLTRLEKCQFFHFSNSFFLQPRKGFLRSRIS